ncbi:thioredoxin-like fold protein [Purpureocillium lavendulum]|uniref:thioredoxin-dependent peroxiredoxin n=1 Tax=Purpureocillium lavendulum TaxID=1247861 RepID=A0AB34FQ65_9HYPO|nr:thioredoxin-like fold protein [Purpureocillium lavendulum]
MGPTLAEQLHDVTCKVDTIPPEIRDAILDAKRDIETSFDPSKVIGIGDQLPEFELSDASGNRVSSASLLANGPVLIAFYRGEWCPFCNLALRAFQQRLHDITAKGVTFVAISPELPDASLTTVEKNELAFPVLSDVGNGLARRLGIVWKQPDTLRPVFEHLSGGLDARNGDDSLEVPVPTTLLVDRTGAVRNVHAQPDYFQRLDPAVALGWIESL